MRNAKFSVPLKPVAFIWLNVNNVYTHRMLLTQKRKKTVYITKLEKKKLWSAKKENSYMYNSLRINHFAFPQMHRRFADYNIQS